ncbi:ATP-binding protein [Ferrovibrio sp.]|uniref:ATP-binding protein n=1 Tax=Ferrovibrio sp. TaxID=1917215 RepID=UPI0025C00C1A|nr:ATP-binding protein [Ferrovibrio sp.]
MGRVSGLLKRILPRSLFGRWLLMLVVPVLLLQGIVTYAFYERHWDTVSRRLALGLAGDIAMMIELYERTKGTPQFDEYVSLAYARMQIEVRVQAGARLPDDLPPPRHWSILDRMLNQALSEIIDEPFAIDTQRNDDNIAVLVELPDGLMVTLARAKRVYSTSTYIFIMWMAGGSLLLLGIAAIFLRNQIRPIRRLAEAADAFGKGREMPGFRPSGATEVRAAALAFLAMRDRIRRHIRERTEILAGVSHDLRTPLTRMRLQLSLMEGSAEAEELRRDVIEMETMINGYLAFARGQTEQSTELTDLGQLLQEVVDDARRSGRQVELSQDQASITLPLRRLGFKRALSNLVENALRYGSRVRMEMAIVAGGILIHIDDNGPGIPQKERHKVFRPFHRADPARHSGQGNVGLGLSIARDAVLAHGGEITLEQSPLGGLRASIRLPL